MPTPSAPPDAFRQTLAAYKQQIDADIGAYCDELLRDTGLRYGEHSREAVAAYCAILRRGGKRLRGALVMASYTMLGGDDQQLALHAARAIEMAHAYILVADDVCDNSDVRRGGPSVHAAMAAYHKKQGWHGDAAQFGRAVAVSASLVGLHLALAEMGRLPAAASRKLAVINNFNRSFITTVHGQFNDIFNQAVRDIDEAQVTRVMTWKTAYYSFLNPLQFGAILAGAGVADRNHFEGYARHMGLSFQITDDIVGTFGDQQESGKSALDDLREGKLTLLVSRALRQADAAQKRRLLALLGKPDLTNNELETCRQIIQDTGALDYARQLAARHAKQAAQALDAWPAHWGRPQVSFLRGIAEYVEGRRA